MYTGNRQKSNMSEQHYLQELSDFIDGNPDPRELKRALAVRMWIEGVTG